MPIGRVLGDRWTIVREIGVGGSASVYEAVHRNGRHVAIKVLHPELVGNRVARRRFESEGYAANRVRHPDAVAILDDGLDADGTVFLVMELLDGYSLTTPLREGRMLPIVVVGMIASRVLDVLAAAHERGVVHRDVKPGNIFVTRDGSVKLLDFGVARVGERLGVSVITQDGSAVGTPEFMAPEQALGHKLDGRADLYALGCVAYWLLTSQLVFKKETPMMLLLAHIQEPPPPLDTRTPGAVPHALKLCVMDCLAKSPEHRPQSARALLARLLEAERELLPDEQWTDERAQAWWQQYQPSTRTSQSIGLTPSPNAQIRIADARQLPGP